MVGVELELIVMV
jgi:hypothetical protein